MVTTNALLLLFFLFFSFPREKKNVEYVWLIILKTVIFVMSRGKRKIWKISLVLFFYEIIWRI